MVHRSTDVSEMMGSFTHLHVTADGRDVILIVATMTMTRNYEPDDALRISFSGGLVHLFSKEDGTNLEVGSSDAGPCSGSVLTGRT